MICNLVNMFEDITSGSYKGCANYLNPDEVQMLLQWYNRFSSKKTTNIDYIIDLLYELYVRENIDYRPYEEYTRIVSSLVEKHHLKHTDFLNLYQQFKEIVFGEVQI